MPRISIVIPYYNARIDWFKETLDSLEAQTFQDFEIIVIDNLSDNPPDLTKERVHEWWRLPTNYVEAVNIGVRRARGQFVIQFSANDTLVPTALQTLIEATAHPMTEFVAPNGSQWTDEIYERCTMFSPATLFQRSLLLEFPQVVPPSGVIGNTDWYQWIEMRRAGIRGVTLPDILGNWRQHDDSLSHAIVAHPGYQETLRWMKEKR